MSTALPLSLRAYRLATSCFRPFAGLLLDKRQRRGKEDASRRSERLGIAGRPRPEGRLAWLHGANVGEAITLLPLAARLAAEGYRILMTTGTVTSATLLATRLPELGLAHRVRHRFVPLDVPGWAARFLDHWRPDAAAIVESEIWPNLLRAAAARAIPLALVNARLSARSHAKWRRIPAIARPLFGGFARIHAQSPADAARLAGLGAPQAALIGNLK